MSKDKLKAKKSLWYSAVFAAIVLAIGINLLINNSYKNKEREYLSRIPDRVSSKDLTQELKQISKNVRSFKNSENKLVESPEYFNRHFVALIPFKESWGTNISYVPAKSCIIFQSAPDQSDYLIIINDIAKLGFDGGYIISNEDLAMDLDSDSYHIYSFSKNQRRLSINNTDSKYKLPARACLEE